VARISRRNPNGQNRTIRGGHREGRHESNRREQERASLHRSGSRRQTDTDTDHGCAANCCAKTLTVYKGGKEFMRESVGIGQDRYPTPTGTFFARELARPGNPRGSYGPWAFGLSGYSNVLTKFGTGDGQIGIHGTNQPAKLGTKVSHGCIRMRNVAITKLAQTLPQGVPVDIRA
jgi:lipoprotein-anchoring transpeptidase ErfK/SrfK